MNVFIVMIKHGIDNRFYNIRLRFFCPGDEFVYYLTAELLENGCFVSVGDFLQLAQSLS